LDIGFGGDNKDSPVRFCGFNAVAPRCVHQYFAQGHSSVGVYRVGNVNVDVEVVVGDADDGHSGDVIEVFVVGAD